MKRMLHIVGAMAPGGFENFIMNVYRNIDREKLQFDFIVCAKKENAYDEEIEALGGKLYYITRKSKNPIKNFLDIRRVVKKNGYDIVCRHTDNAFAVLDLLAAAMGGAGVRILHSHSTTTGAMAAHKFFRMFMSRIPTKRFACSEAAGMWMFGRRSFRFIPNAIDLEQFAFSETEREKLRREWGLEGKHVYGHVGNFVYAKNHPFLMEILISLCRQDEKAVCLLAGDGEGRQAAEAAVSREGLSDRIRFLGARKDVPKLLQLFDVFLFPSVYEGLPVSVIEAQAEGLPCLISENITKDVVLTDSVKKLEVSVSGTEETARRDALVKKWVKRAQELVLQQEKGPEAENGTGSNGRYAAGSDFGQSICREEVSSRNRELLKKAGYEVKDLAAFYENL